MPIDDAESEWRRVQSVASLLLNNILEGISGLRLLQRAAHKLVDSFAVRCAMGPSPGKGQASATEQSGPLDAGTSPSSTQTRESGDGHPNRGLIVPNGTGTPGGSGNRRHPHGYARVSNMNHNGAQPQQEDAIYVFSRATTRTYSPPLDTRQVDALQLQNIGMSLTSGDGAAAPVRSIELLHYSATALTSYGHARQFHPTSEGEHEDAGYAAHAQLAHQ